MGVFLMQMGVVLILTIFTLVTSEDPTTSKGMEGSNLPLLTKEVVSIRAPLGATIWTVCEGNFGHLRTKDADWVSFNEETYEYKEKHRNRFNITKYEGNEGIKGANLTVINVTQGDYNIILMCVLSSTTKDIYRNFTILPPIPLVVVRHDVGLKVIVPVVVVFAGLVILALVLGVCFGPQIYMYFYSCCPCVRPSSTEKFRYDTIVIHDQIDNEFTLKHIKPYLKELPQLNVEFLGRTLSAGAPLFEGIQELIRDSFCAMFVITPDVNPVLFRHLLDAAKGLKRKIMIVKAHPEGLDIHRWHRENTYSINLRDLEKKYLRYLLNITWPGNHASARRRNNFWCTVRKQLPFPSQPSSQV